MQSIHSTQHSTLDALSPSLRWFGRAYTTVRDQIQAITTARELLKLNDYALRDIGADRAELERVSLSLPEPFEQHSTRLPIR